MSGKILIQAFALFMLCGTSCVDSKYDLSDIDTDNLVVGDEWVAPLGTGSVTVEDVIDLNKVEAIKADKDGSYVARYSGKLDPHIGGLRNSHPDFDPVASTVVSLGDLKGLFADDFNLSLVDPHLMLESSMTSGVLDCRLDIVGKPTSALTSFTLSPTTPDIWIGPNAKYVTPGFTFHQNNDLPKVIAEVPDSIFIYLLGHREQAAQLPVGALSNLNYTLEIPFTPAPDFEATTVERLKDAFDETFVDYVFSGGTAKIYGTVTNGMPFDLTIEMVILDEQEQPLDIKLPLQPVNGASGDVEFILSEKDMEKMATARNLDFKLHLTGRSTPEPLKQGQEITLKLKLKKTGGISI